MNVKEIAKVIGKDETSIRRWVKRAAGKMPAMAGKMLASTSTHPADFDLEETIAIIEVGLGKKAAGMYRRNAEKDAVSDKPASGSVTVKDLEYLTVSFARIIAESNGSLDRRMTAIEDKLQERQALLPAPQMSNRDNLNMIIREFSSTTGIPYGEVWGMIFKEIYLVLNINLRQLIEYVDMPVIEYIEMIGLLSEALFVARKILK